MHAKASSITKHLSVQHYREGGILRVVDVAHEPRVFGPRVPDVHQNRNVGQPAIHEGKPRRSLGGPLRNGL